VVASGFGEILTRHRVNAGFSQSSLAELAGLSVETIGALERGTRRAPYPATIEALAEALRIGDTGRLELLAAADRSRARTVAKEAPATPPFSALPRPLTTCIGRSREIDDILGLLSESRVVTLTGPAGIGKTRILFEVVERLSAASRATARLVDLAALESSKYLLSAIAVACGSPDAGDVKTIDDLTRFLRPQNILLLLDNCEHVVADVALAVTSISKSCPNIAILATSRERLALTGERIYRIPSLAPRAALDLMLERMSSIDADFKPSDDDATILAEICSALDQIPLAIELAAARIPTLGLQAVRTRLRGGLSLSGGARDLPARQQTMVAAVAWSYSLLEDSEQSVMNRLSVLAGGFTLESAMSVCGTTAPERERVPDLVVSLIDKSLVDAHLVDEAVRYRMFEVIRAFARERLAESAETTSTMQRLARWCGDLADHVTVTGESRTPIALRRYLTPELNNVRSALQWALESGQDPLLAGRIVAGLRVLWHSVSLKPEGKRWAQAALAQLDERQFPDIASRLLNVIIRATYGVSVGPWIERAIAVTALTGDQRRLLELERSLAIHYFLIGRISEADEAAARAMAIIEGEGLLHLSQHADLLSLRVWIRVEQGRFAEAWSDVVTGEAIHRSLGESEPVNWWLTRAFLLYEDNNNAEALQLIAVVIDRASTSPHVTEELLAAYAYLALFQLSTGNIEEARTAAREVLLRARDRNDYWPPTSIALLAAVAAHRGTARIAFRLLAFVASWQRGQSYAPTIALRRTMELARAAIAGQVPTDAAEILETEGARMELRAAIESALAI